MILARKGVLKESIVTSRAQAPGVSHTRIMISVLSVGTNCGASSRGHTTSTRELHHKCAYRIRRLIVRSRV